MIRAFFDCSGKGHDPNVEWVALAGYIAPEEEWRDFDKAWSSALGGLPYLHMAELMRSDTSGTPYEGMTHGDKIRLLHRVAAAIIGLGDDFRMFGVACAVNKADHAVAHANPSLNVGSIEEECGHVCFAHIFERYGNAEAMQFFYDREEQVFFKRILEAWDNKKSRRQHRMVSKLKTKPAPVSDMREFPGMQAADFLGWHTYRAHVEKDPMLAFLPMHSAVTRFVTMDRAYWAGERPDEWFLPDPR